MRDVPLSCLVVQLVPYHRQPLCSPLKPSLSSPARKETKIKAAMTLGQSSLPWIENKWHLAQGRMPQGSRTRQALGSKDNHFHLLLVSSEESVLEFIYNKATFLSPLGIFHVKLLPVNGPQLFELYWVLNLTTGSGNPKKQ